jgi:glycosyltransferase involved in cell wall biosynthesis
MRIGFDAKRAYHNNTGLGNYSRTLINNLARFAPGNEYFLFNPRPSRMFPQPVSGPVKEILPDTLLTKNFSSMWRSFWLTKYLKSNQIDIYHGLSHEIPYGMKRSGIPSVVTIHDLIFELYPDQFSPMDVFIFRKKFKYACKHSDRIIAISDQTKYDIVNMYGIDQNKIDVCYQGCHPMFETILPEAEREIIRKRYRLPEKYFLYVGSIIERKNLLGISKALHLARSEMNIPLVVIGSGKQYKQKVKQYLAEHDLLDRVIFLSDDNAVTGDPEFVSSASFPAIYQMASAMIYPSFYEGFGLPVLEAVWSRIPVITSNLSCLPEAGGPGAFYVNPSEPAEIADAMLKIASQNEPLTSRLEQGIQHAMKFSAEATTMAVLDVYAKVLGSSNQGAGE